MRDDSGQYNWQDKLTEIYRSVIAGGDETDGMGRQQAFDVCIPRIRDMVEAGDIALPVDDMIRSALTRIDEQEGASADKVLRRLMRGEDALPFGVDPWLDVVVTLGQGRRKPWRNIGHVDLAEMDRLRYDNVRAAQNAYDEWRDDYDAAVPLVIRYGTFGEAAAAGVFMRAAS